MDAAVLVREARLDAGLSQRELAERAGTRQSNIAAIESGRRGISEELLKALLIAADYRPSLALEDAASIAGWRQSAELRTLATGGAELIGDEEAAWAVAYSEQPQSLAPTAGHRTIQVVAVQRLDEVMAHIAPHAAFLQTAGIAAAPQELFRLAELLGQAGVTRIAAIGAMTAPEAGWHHDGRFNLLDLVRMVEVEHSAERAADGFAPYAQEEHQ
jgi:transcriptional regulator with XRE-family HTH domain